MSLSAAKSYLQDISLSSLFTLDFSSYKQLFSHRRYANTKSFSLSTKSLVVLTLNCFFNNTTHIFVEWSGIKHPSVEELPVSYFWWGYEGTQTSVRLVLASLRI